jgi:tetratricopeptide (TPR) repeat protein
MKIVQRKAGCCTPGETASADPEQLTELTADESYKEFKMKKTAFFAEKLLVAALMFILVLSSCKNAEDLAQKGDEYFGAGEYEQAVAFYDKAIQKKPSPQFYLSRSEAYLKQENTAAALEDLNTAINLDSSLIDAYNARASVYYIMEDYDSARSDYNQALSIDPENQNAKQGTSAIDEIEDRAATNALKNTTWWGIPIIAGVKMELNDSFMWTILYFGENTCKMETKVGSFYYGPSYGPLYNGARLVMKSNTEELGSFEVKRNKLLVGGTESGELTGSTIRVADEEIRMMVELEKGEPPHALSMTVTQN